MSTYETLELEQVSKHLLLVRLNRPDYRMMRDARLRRAPFS